MSPEQAQARLTGSMVGRMFTVWASSCMKCSPAACPSRRPIRWKCCGKCATTSRSLPGSSVRDIPPELEQICLKALAKQQQNRYTTAADFAEDLRRILPATAGPSLFRSNADTTSGDQSQIATPATFRPSSDTPRVEADSNPRSRAPPGDRSGLRVRSVRVRSVPGDRNGGSGSDSRRLSSRRASRRFGTSTGRSCSATSRGYWRASATRWPTRTPLAAPHGPDSSYSTM